MFSIVRLAQPGRRVTPPVVVRALDVSRGCAASTGVMDASKLRELTDWLIDGGRSAASPSRFMAECCERMVAAGLPLWRIGVFVRTLHPEIYGRNFIWKPGAEVEVGSADYKFLESPDFQNSPLIIVFQQGIVQLKVSLFAGCWS